MLSIQKKTARIPSNKKKVKRLERFANLSCPNSLVITHLDGKTFDLDGKTYDLDGKTFDLNGKTYDLNGKTFDLNGKAFDLNGKAYALDGKAFHFDGKTYALDGKASHFDIEENHPCGKYLPPVKTFIFGYKEDIKLWQKTNYYEWIMSASL